MENVTTQDTNRIETRPVAVALAIWSALSLLLAASGLVGRVAPAVPAIVFGLAGLTLLAHRRSRAVRAAVSAVDTRTVVLLHGTRAVIGAAFLFEHARGLLPDLFAQRAGWGDIVVGVLAVVVAIARPRPRVVLAWSVFGLADILLAVGTAGYTLFVLGDGRFANALARFPYGTLPTFIVPLVITSHLLIIKRTWRAT